MKINTECEKSDRLTVTKLNNANKPYKQDYKSKLMTEKYSLLPIHPQQILRYNLLTPLDPHKLNIQEPPSHWCPLIHHYQSLENTFLDNLTLIKL